MNYKMIFIVIISAIVSLTAFSGEKGGSGTGIFGAEAVILEDFKQSKQCPEVHHKNLCIKIDEKINDLMWDIKTKNVDEQNEEEFYYACCLKAQ